MVVLLKTVAIDIDTRIFKLIWTELGFVESNGPLVSLHTKEKDDKHQPEIKVWRDSTRMSYDNPEAAFVSNN